MSEQITTLLQALGLEVTPEVARDIARTRQITDQMIGLAREQLADLDADGTVAALAYQFSRRSAAQVEMIAAIAVVMLAEQRGQRVAPSIDEITRAINDPGAVVKRRFDTDGEPAESIGEWGARAVFAVLVDGPAAVAR
ncbi:MULTISPECIES: hypothetical protein [Catenuloplanes]|uniref:Uncharacterized protein n=1 Tax=Catenuloplanes niger TaxID=587534 RepID=A0AAE3ZQU1_9ACTN|nr:hypothetical protein [Catenuloplanes niger]MDR7323402.1 hypothetical protein [Catenuloplanes niger]